MRIYWVDELQSGKIGMMARPRGNDWLEDEIKKLSLKNVDILLSLLETQEIRELELEEEAYFCKKYNLQFLHFPIQDRNIPENKKAFIRLVSFLASQIKLGKKIVIHCRMGIGRTATVTAALLIKCGFSAKGIFEFLKQKRELQVPDTEQQIKFIEEISEEINN
ncbi:protein-tyrosine phosphatase family protein [Chondrinema litorale]|uniref:protein-tyrosine phosphatase family protein n=1 Tax=Chondrinema litorale TaxID=2994555 RepID=UPI0025437179|nr:dual specificity protein phosphatase family protein [Chondrinema litorale]UZR95858.1 dual specificity protein phosphatase family protein [Chondrinema litorale]